MSFSEMLADDVDAILDDAWGPSETVTYRRETAPGTYSINRAVVVHFMRGVRERNPYDDGRGDLDRARVFVKTHVTEGVVDVQIGNDLIVRADASVWSVKSVMREGTGSRFLEVEKFAQVSHSGRVARIER